MNKIKLIETTGVHVLKSKKFQTRVFYKNEKLDYIALDRDVDILYSSFVLSNKKEVSEVIKLLQDLEKEL